MAEGQLEPELKEQQPSRWMSFAEAEAWKKHIAKNEARFWKRMLYRDNDLYIKRLIAKTDPGTLAYIIVGNTRKMAFVTADQKTAYKMEGQYNRTIVKWPKFTFERRCTSFDV